MQGPCTSDPTRREQELSGRADRTVKIRDDAVELLFVDSFQNRTHLGARLDAERQEVPAEQERSRRAMLDAERTGSIEEPIHRAALELARAAAQAVGLRKTSQQFKVDLSSEAPERAVPDLFAHFKPGTRLQMVRHQTGHLPADVIAANRVDVQAIQEGERRGHALLLVIK